MNPSRPISSDRSRLVSGMGCWSKPSELSNDPQRSEQNPVLFQSPDSAVWLFHTSKEPHNRRTFHVVCRTSKDSGRTWLPPRVFFSKLGIFTRSPILVLKNGDWLLPGYYCTNDGDYSIVKLSSDHGASWSEIQVPGSEDRVQMNIVDLDDGRQDLLFAFRRPRPHVVASDNEHASEKQLFGANDKAHKRSSRYRL